MTSVARNGSPLDRRFLVKRACLRGVVDGVIWGGVWVIRRYLGKNGGTLGGDPKSWGEFTDM
jgi:hypothetical protein